MAHYGLNSSCASTNASARCMKPINEAFMFLYFCETTCRVGSQRTCFVPALLLA